MIVFLPRTEPQRSLRGCRLWSASLSVRGFAVMARCACHLLAAGRPAEVSVLQASLITETSLDLDDGLNMPGGRPFYPLCCRTARTVPFALKQSRCQDVGTGRDRDQTCLRSGHDRSTLGKRSLPATATPRMSPIAHPRRQPSPCSPRLRARQKRSQRAPRQKAKLTQASNATSPGDSPASERQRHLCASGLTSVA